MSSAAVVIDFLRVNTGLTVHVHKKKNTADLSIICDNTSLYTKAIIYNKTLIKFN